jgi:DnaJ-class molecular chaperone
MFTRECDICFGIGLIQNNMDQQQPCWQCGGSGNVEDSKAYNDYYDDDDD